MGKVVTIIKVRAKGKKFLVNTDLNDEEYTFVEDVIVNNRIIKGAIFSEEEWNLINNNQSTSMLLDKMLHFIDYKMRTEKEVIQKLNELKAQEKQIIEVINRLKEINYLDDERYANQYVQECINQGKGKVFVKYNLEQKGVENSIISQALNEYHNDTERKIAKTVAINYQRTINSHPSLKQKELIMQKLIRNGFSLDIANTIIRNIEFEEDSLENLAKEYDKLLDKTTDQNKIITSLLQKGYRYSDIKKVIKS